MGDKGDKGEDGVGVKGSSGAPGAPGKTGLLSSLMYLLREKLGSSKYLDTYFSKGLWFWFCSVNVILHSTPLMQYFFTSGVTGAPGIGTDGKQGERGEIGSPGAPGTSGPRGPSGQPGLCDPSTCISRIPPLYMVGGKKSASYKNPWDVATQWRIPDLILSWPSLRASQKSGRGDLWESSHVPRVNHGSKRHNGKQRQYTYVEYCIDVLTCLWF